MSSLKFNTLANPNKMDCENSCWFLMHRQLKKKKEKKKVFLNSSFPFNLFSSHRGTAFQVTSHVESSAWLCPAGGPMLSSSVSHWLGSDQQVPRLGLSFQFQLMYLGRFLSGRNTCKMQLSWNTLFSLPWTDVTMQITNLKLAEGWRETGCLNKAVLCGLLYFSSFPKK